ncbi:hypothetical protein ACFPM0_23675 [Pseudonocardia sulfidoxydans]|uniref:hypothetical protein n=1 Tax=Pseudonocardia sulfidoxydans TaxID=54011 RepID=UPI00361B4CFB
MEILSRMRTVQVTSSVGHLATPTWAAGCGHGAHRAEARNRPAGSSGGRAAADSTESAEHEMPGRVPRQQPSPVPMEVRRRVRV